jgi:uncharacterized membrane protein HdeD (DUF308 family)
MAAVVEGVSRRAWQLAATRAGLAIVVGAILLSRPGKPLGALFAMLGSYLFFDGALAIGMAFSGANGRETRMAHVANPSRTRVSHVLEGILSLAVGILAFLHPAAMKLALVALIAVRSIVTGIVELGWAISRARVERERSPLPWLAGLASLAFGFFLVARPASGVLVLAWLAGIYLLVFGVGLAVSAVRLRRARTDTAQG